MAPPLFELPAILVSVSYRLHPAVEYPLPVKDSIAALKWVRDNIAQYGGSPDRLFVGGHSAGGHIAALMALRPDWIAEAGLPIDTLKAAFCVSTSFSRRGLTGTPAAGYKLAPGPLPLQPESPLTLLANARVPFHITWGGTERQRERVERSSMQMLGALRDANVRAEWLFMPDADHFGTHLETGRPRNPWTREVGLWMTS
jgi:acetyl esterase/lipase